MQRYLLIRLVQAIFAIWAVTIVAFALSHASGDPTLLLMSWDATEERRAEVRQHRGLDRPLPVQYWKFLSNAVQGDFGESQRRPGRDAMGLVLSRLPATLQLVAPALLLAVILGVPLGVISAVWRDTPLDYLGKILALLGQAAPAFWVGLMLMWVFSVELGWLPTSGKGGIDHMIMPVIAIGWFQVAAIMRLVRSAMLDNLDSEYIKLARIKGLAERKVIWSDIPQIEPPFLDIAPAGMLPTIISHTKGVKCVLIRSTRVNHICQFSVNQFCRFTSSAWPRCWAASVR